MEIKNIGPEDFDASIALSEYAFQNVLSPERREQVIGDYRSERMWGCFIDGRLASKMTILPLKAWIHGRKFPMGGVASVATWPEHRRRGLVSKLLKHGLQHMRNQGQLLSFLAPFSFSFYRKFGWEILTEHRKYELEVSQLPKYPVYPGTVTRTKERRVLQSVYEPYAVQYSGTLARDEEWWEKQLRDPDDRIAVYTTNEGSAEGYLWYKIKDRVMTVYEFPALSEEARHALWRYIMDHDSMLQKVILEQMPMDDALPFLLENPRIKQEIIPYFMARIVDVQPFLEQFPWAAAESSADALALQVQDDHAPWNNGVFQLRWAANEGPTAVVKLEPSQADQPDHRLTCDIQTLTAMLMGYKRPSFMHRIGRLQGSRDLAERLDQRIPAAATALFDFF